ncbi:Polypyrimidine tract-binding protein 1 [Pelomyxa schiedti]|nr:Polypyrimidine tract-binding protein 1 [Pelomyxa schiedti]
MKRGIEYIGQEPALKQDEPELPFLIPPTVAQHPPPPDSQVQIPQPQQHPESTDQSASDSAAASSSASSAASGSSAAAVPSASDAQAPAQKKFKLEGFSRVLHVRSLPSDATEEELTSLVRTFGPVSNCMLLKAKRQAFIEMVQDDAAANAIACYALYPPNIRGQVIYFQYSSYTELKIPEPSDTAAKPEANKILLITVSNLIYPVTIEDLYSIFSRFGSVLRIVLFSKKAGFQGLIEMSTVTSASNAKNTLDGNNIYNGCCTLTIQYSNLQELVVKMNNERSRDFTVAAPSIPPPPAPAMAAKPFFPVSEGIVDFSAQRSVGLPATFFDPRPAAYNATAATGIPMGLPQQFGMFESTSDKSVLIVSNLVPESITCQKLFILFGVYGDVIRVKILYNKKHTALVQLSDHQQAEQAMLNLNGVTLYGKAMNVNFSKYTSIVLPKPTEPDDLTKDFTNSPLHRYKIKGSKNLTHICPPGNTLHLSNLAPTVTEEQLSELFNTCGTVTKVKFFQKDRKMALVQMGSVNEAIKALVELHGNPLSGSCLRVSFTKSTI